jgi:6-phosphogluconolactonase
MDTQILPTDDDVAHRGAAFIVAQARLALAARGSFHFAFSGGKTPWVMLRDLAQAPLPWAQIHIYQVDERIAPEGHDDRNLTHLREAFTAPLPAENLHAMPVNDADLDAAVQRYAGLFANRSLDLVHLGLGPDGHTASLIPGDPVLNVVDADVALTGVYQNRRRMTMTYPLLNRARQVLWLVTGESKAPVVPRLLAGDPSIPAGRIAQTHALLLLDPSARGR